jgi:hypothetical protein
VRQGQQHRRGRGRGNNNNNNRKSQNPLSRSFESNGPDVKIRGTPAHIAEKYIALARDAQSSGDHVLAENYLQHAEHYNRIIMAYREQFAPQGDGMNGHRHQQDGNGADDMGEDENQDILDEGFIGGPQPQVAAQFTPQPQPMQPREGRFEGGREMRDNRDHQRNDRPFRRDHQPRFRDRGPDNRPDRPDRQDRPMRDDRQMRDDRPMREDRPVREDRPMREDRPVREDRPPREERPPVETASEAPETRRPPRERFPAQHEQPDFLRRPVRRPRAEAPEVPAAAAKQEPPSE